MIGSKCILKRGSNYCGAKGICDVEKGGEENCAINKTLIKISRHSRLKSIGEAAVSDSDLMEARSRVQGLMSSQVAPEKKMVLENLAKKLDREIKRRG